MFEIYRYIFCNREKLWLPRILPSRFDTWKILPLHGHYSLLL